MTKVGSKAWCNGRARNAHIFAGSRSLGSTVSGKARGSARRGPGSASNAATIKYKRDPLTPGAGRGRSPLRHTQRRVWRPATATSMPAAGLLASAYSTPARRAAGTPRPVPDDFGMWGVKPGFSTAGLVASPAVESRHRRAAPQCGVAAGVRVGHVEDEGRGAGDGAVRECDDEPANSPF